MEILLAKEMGFCKGVRRAIGMMEKAVSEHGRVVSLGPIVHNPQVVAALAEKGVQVTNSIDGVSGVPLAITAHGVGPKVLEEAKAKGLDIIDTTCPIVTRSQRWAKKMAADGFTVIVYGDADHPEVEGILSWADGKGIALGDDDVHSLPRELLSRVAIIPQTTQSPIRFAAFIGRLLRERLVQLNELRVVNTLCNFTASQQAAARELAQQVELMVVVGGHNSANCRHLAEVCCEAGVETHYIETAAELERQWLIGRERVGITAGASTPDWAVEEVVRCLRELAPR
ncbi:MAG: 4-hydroxy-3-methylbut-2-enyl diphosphate reductase [Dehalococcoidia bacterium]|nr:4-hydroxy-3-methylbut-2-enyl diphosphate reductase [Dehalococcoidia bacterium]